MDTTSTLVETELALGTVVGTITSSNPMLTNYALSVIVVASTTDCGTAISTTGPISGVAVTGIPVTVSPPSPSLPADGSTSYGLCVMLRDAAGGNAVSNVTIRFIVTRGYVGGGTAREFTVATNQAGNAGTVYRGAGFEASTEVVSARADLLNRTAIVSITLTGTVSSASAGVVVDRIEFTKPTFEAIAATVSNGTSRYVSPVSTTSLSVRAIDFNGSGVIGVQLQLTTDRGRVVPNPAFVTNSVVGLVALCATANARTILAPTREFDLDVPNGIEVPGSLNFTLCAKDTDEPGLATISATVVTNANVKSDTGVLISGVPSELDHSFEDDGTLRVTVRDAKGNHVADGTPVRFTLPRTIGSVSTTCAATKNGSASALVIVDNAASVLTSTDWSEFGTAPACSGSTGAKVLTISVPVSPVKVAAPAPTTPAARTPGTSTPGTTTPAPAAGPPTATYNTIPTEGGFGLMIFSGGIATELVTASKCPVGSMVIFAAVAGFFVSYVPGTQIAAVNEGFMALYPGRIPPNTPFIGRCR